MVIELEICPLFNAGVGGVLNRDGLPELDAAIMDGRDRSCGAVAGVSRSKSPVRLARAIMERSPHVMFMGNGADELNAELGLDVVEPEKSGDRRVGKEGGRTVRVRGTPE